MPATRASSIARTPAASARTSACDAAPDDVALRGNELPRQRLLERGQPASREQRVVAVDLGHQRLLRRHGEHLRRGHAQHLRRVAHLPVDFGVDLGLRTSGRPTARRSCSGRRCARPWSRASSPARCWFQTSRSVLVTPASAARTNSTACALGSRFSVSSGSVPIAFRPGVSRITRPCCSSGCGKLMIAWRQHGISIVLSSSSSSAASMSSLAVAEEPVLARQVDRHALDLRHAAERLAHLLGRREVERERDPLVGVVLELGEPSRP